MNYDEDLITPAQHTKYRETGGVHHAPSRTRTVLFENFNADDSEHEEPDTDQDKAATIGHHGRSQPRSDSPYNSSRSPSNSNDPSYISNFDKIWEEDNNELFLSGIMETSGIGPLSVSLDTTLATKFLSRTGETSRHCRLLQLSYCQHTRRMKESYLIGEEVSYIEKICLGAAWRDTR